MIPLKIRVKNTLITAFSLQLSGLSLATEAADFSKASQVYVPPSSYDRRIDFSSIREHYAVPNKVKSTSKTASKGASPQLIKATVSKTTKAGKIAAKASSGVAAPKVTTPAVTSLNRSAVRSLPPPALSHSTVNGQSFHEIAKSLTSKMPDHIARMKQTAQELVKSGKLDEAQRVMTKISQLTPQDKENLKDLGAVSLQRAKQYLKSDNYSEAIVAARQTLAIDPNSADAHGILNQVYQKAGADPGDVTHRLRTADALYKAGRYHEAEVEYRASMNVKPTPDAHVGIGKVSEKIHGAGSGKQHFERALELNSNSSDAHRELGIAHLNKGNIVEANSALSRAVILNPKDKEAGQQLVGLWQQQINKAPNANSHLGLARAYQLTGDLPNAQAEYREVVRLEPNHPYLPAARQSFKSALAKQESEKSFAAAKNLESQGLLSDAFQKASEAATYSAGNTGYKIYQGELLERMGQPAQAKQIYMNVLKDDPNNVAAAQKIKNLPADLAAAAGAGLGIAGSLAASQKGHPSGFPGTKFPWPTTALPSSIPNLTTPAMSFGGTSGPVGGALPFPTGATGGLGGPEGQVDHVGQLSNFIQQAGMASMAWKVKNDKLDDAARDMRKNFLKAFSGDGDAAPAGGAPSSMASNVAAAAGAGAGAADDDIVDKILKSPVGSPLPTAAAGALAAPQSMAAAAGTTTPTSVASAGSKSAIDKLKDLEKKNQELQAKIKQLSSKTASKIPNKTTAAAPPTAPSYSKVLPTDSQNGMSAAPLMQSALPNAMPQTAPAAFAQNAAASPSFSNAPTQYQTPSFLAPSTEAVVPQYQTPSFLAPSAEAVAPQYQTPSFLMPQTSPQYQAPSFLTAPTSVPQSNAPAPTGAMAPSTGAHQLRGPITGNGGTTGLRFELKQIKPTMSNVQLRVVLRNDGDQALNIPENLQAIIRYPDMHESEVKIAFDNKSIPAHASSDGVVKVPFDKVDPTADLVLRNISPQELHLITTVVQRP